MILWSAFLMGLAGSLHCGLMCGPLAMAVPVAQTGKGSKLISRLVYNTGRVIAYSGLGLVFGFIGKSLFLVGFQRWLSIIAGGVMVIFLIAEHYHGASVFSGPSRWIRSLFAKFLHQRSYPAILALGMTNGLLPCGLVYMAGAASVASGSVLASVLYMSIFGLGTVPIMTLIACAGSSGLSFVRKVQFKPIVTIALMTVALSLIVRGMGLGIPYLSPKLSSVGVACPACEE